MSRWIVNPAMDLLFCCGGLLWLLVAVNQCFPTASAGLMLPLVAFGTQAFAHTHITATLFRLYRCADSRREFAVCAYALPIVALAMLCVVLFVNGALGVLLRLYFAWVVQHYISQAYGLMLLYCAKVSFRLLNWERQSIAMLLRCTAVCAVLRQFASNDWLPATLLGQKVPVWNLLPDGVMEVAAVVVALTACVVAMQILARLMATREALPLPAMMLLLTSLAIFLSGKEQALVLWLYAPVFFHATQYLCLTLKQHLREENADGSGVAIFNYFCKLFAAAVLLYAGVPSALSLCGVDYQFAVVSVFCVLSLHHFIVDGVIWKLRNPKLRAALVA